MAFFRPRKNAQIPGLASRGPAHRLERQSKWDDKSREMRCTYRYAPVTCLLLCPHRQAGDEQ